MYLYHHSLHENDLEKVNTPYFQHVWQRTCIFTKYIGLLTYTKHIKTNINVRIECMLVSVIYE